MYSLIVLERGWCFCTRLPSRMSRNSLWSVQFITVNVSIKWNWAGAKLPKLNVFAERMQNVQQKGGGAVERSVSVVIINCAQNTDRNHSNSWIKSIAAYLSDKSICQLHLSVPFSHTHVNMSSAHLIEMFVVYGAVSGNARGWKCNYLTACSLFISTWSMLSYLSFRVDENVAMLSNFEV